MRNPLPPGALALGIGLGLLGVSSYVFLGLSARVLSPASFATLSVLWVLYNVVGPGLMSPVELEVSRAVADRRARSLGTASLLRRAAAVTAGLLGLLLVVTAVASPVLLTDLFDGSAGLLAALVCSYVGVCAAYLTRGALSGTGRFQRYSGQLAVEGAVRIVGSVLLFVLAVRSAGAWGAVLAAAVLVAVLVTLPPRADHDRPGPPAPWSELSGALGWLLATSVLSQLLINSGPVLVKLLATGAEAEAAGPLLAAIVLARVPLFLFTAVQAVLLPRMATLLGEGRRAEFRAGMRQLLLAVGGLGLAGVLAMLVAGPRLLALTFGPGFELSTTLLTLLAAGSGLYMVGMVFNHALIAHRAYRSVTAGWGVGVVALVVTVVVVPDIIDKMVYGFLLGSGLTALTLALLLRRAMRSPATAALAPGTSPRQR